MHLLRMSAITRTARSRRLATYIQVEYGHFEEYIDWLNSTWKPTMEATKKAGLIIDYKVFSATPKSPDLPDIILWITFKKAAAASRRLCLIL